MGRKKKLELKGNVKLHLAEEKKEKMAETLERMEQSRQIDSNRLRDIIIQKLKWVEEEKKKGETVKQELLQKMEILKHQMIRLEGIILFINDLLNPPEKDETK
jgi:hypothetical protein